MGGVKDVMRGLDSSIFVRKLWAPQLSTSALGVLRRRNASFVPKINSLGEWFEAFGRGERTPETR